MQAGIITTESHEWLETLAKVPHDFYHLPAYLRLYARQEAGEAFGYLAREDGNQFFLPLILRPLPHFRGFGDDWKDSICPYGYAGPLVKMESAEDPDGFLSRAVRGLVCELRASSVVSAFFRLHTLLPCPLEPLQQEGCLVSTGDTVTIDLSLSLEEMWQQTRSGHRSDINRARKNGYEVEMIPFEPHLDTFHDIYHQTMLRVGAKDHYLFTRDYFTELKSILDDRLHLCAVRIEGEIACAALFTEVGGIVQYHLSGVRDEFVNCHPSKFMLDFVRRWAKERGNRYFHLGGGLGSRRDSLFDFKAGFSKLFTPFHTWRVVTDPVAYARLTSQWEQEAQANADDLDGFFPAYRKPLPESAVAA